MQLEISGKNGFKSSSFIFAQKNITAKKRSEASDIVDAYEQRMIIVTAVYSLTAPPPCWARVWHTNSSNNGKIAIVRELAMLESRLVNRSDTVQNAHSTLHTKRSDLDQYSLELSTARAKTILMGSCIKCPLFDQWIKLWCKTKHDKKQKSLLCMRYCWNCLDSQ